MIEDGWTNKEIDEALAFVDDNGSLFGDYYLIILDALVFYKETNNIG